MQTIPLYHTTGISGFRITRIRTVARSGKTVEIESRDECAKAVRREGRLSRRGCGGRRQLVITIERKDAVCPDCGSAKAKYYKAGVRLIQCQGFGRLKAFVEVAVHHIYCPECRSMSYPQDVHHGRRGRPRRLAPGRTRGRDPRAGAEVQVGAAQGRQAHRHRRGVRVPRGAGRAAVHHRRAGPGHRARPERLAGQGRGRAEDVRVAAEAQRRTTSTSSR